MKVVKLGGSLLETGQMFNCLQHILKTSKPTAVVCGGGDFANYVRQAQKKWNFDDVAAHEMAILAMKQTAIMCQNLHPEFVIATSILEIKVHRFVIWTPDIQELNADKIRPSWEVTSDSLAAWLATKLNAEKLIVVKAEKVDASLSLVELCELEIIDDAFADFVKNAEFELEILSAKAFLNS